MHPPPLQALIEHFESLPEPERREGLIDLAEAAPHCAPKPGERFDFEQVRKDTECSDMVGIHLRRDAQGRMHLAVSLGRQVQTLTRALAVLLCRGLEGASAQEIAAVPADFIDRVAGGRLVTARGKTVYYMLNRIKEAAAGLLNQPVN